MALTITNNIDGATRFDHMAKGLKCVQAKVTIGATSDYSSGIDMAAVGRAVGLNKVWAVLGADLRASGGTIRPLDFRYDQNTNKVRLYKPNSSVLHISTTAVGNVGSGEDDGISYTLPAGTLAFDGQGLRITSWGKCGAGANTKRIRLYFGAGGSRLLGLIGTANAVATDWKIVATLIRTGAATQEAGAFGIMGIEDSATMTNNVTAANQIEPTQTLANAIVIKTTLEATNNDDAVNEGLMVELIGGAGASPAEITAANDLAAGDILVATILGV